MKRLFILLPALLLSVFMFNAFSHTAYASVNDFTVTNYESDYYLSKDSDNRSQLKIVDTITADFPQSNSNHGLERAIPKKYDGHPVHLKITSVTNEAGEPLKYSTNSSNGNEVVRIGDPDVYVHGPQTYVITYEQSDVTKSYQSTKADEFFWDINGIEWAVPIQRLTVRLHVDDSISQAQTGSFACYVGKSGSTEKCNLQKYGTEYVAQASNLSAGENITLAIAFNPGTFAGYVKTEAEYIQQIILIAELIVSAIAVALFIILNILWSKWSERRAELKSIYPEYIPPKNRSVSASSSLLNSYQPVFSAQLIDFAVRHYIKIYLTHEKSFIRNAEYDIEITGDVTELLPEERELLNDIFEGKTAIGQRLALKSLQKNRTVSISLMDNTAKLKELVRGEYGLRAKDANKSQWFKRAGWIILVCSILTLNPFLLLVAIFSFSCVKTLWPLTDAGLELRRYLLGLKMYIGAAETERLKMLQSPEGAEKVGDVTSDKGQLVKLYERVLPYAILFGQEKQWNQHLGRYYETSNSQPTWYVGGNELFSAAVFSSAISSFSTSASSSSGGSDGGGSSGGGGGGGGGGGW